MELRCTAVIVVNIECNTKSSVFIWKRNWIWFCCTVNFKRYSCSAYFDILIDILVTQWVIISGIGIIIIVRIICIRITWICNFFRCFIFFNFISFLYISCYKSLFRLDCVAVIIICSDTVIRFSFCNGFRVCWRLCFICRVIAWWIGIFIIKCTCCTAYCYSSFVGWNALVFFCEPVVIWAEIAVLKSVEVVGTIALFKLDTVKPRCTRRISNQAIHTDWRCCTRHICCYADSLPIKCACKSDTVDFFYSFAWWIKTLNFEDCSDWASAVNLLYILCFYICR